MVDPVPSTRRPGRRRLSRNNSFGDGDDSAADSRAAYASFKQSLRNSIPEIIDITGEEPAQIFTRDDQQLAPPEGSGGAEGIVLPLNIIGSVFDITYTVYVDVGGGPSDAQENAQKMALQVDTGSSDMWIASTNCNTDPCKATGGHLYNTGSSSSAVPANVDFTINYLQGSVSGPVFWDTIQLGGYSVGNQAIAAATSVTSEPLGPLFNGLFGLALPLDSIIGNQLLQPVTGNAADGQTFPSNLFSITPTTSAPSARFFSLLLQRPGSATILSQLGIGRHPVSVVPPGQEAKVEYFPLISERAGTLFWKTSVRDVTVWVNGIPSVITLPVGSNSVSGAAYPSAVLDSGVPLIFTTTAIANGIYGAIGISPSQNGMFFVPCDKPLNMTITLDDRKPTPIHPLDLTGEPSSASTQQKACIGLIQTADQALISNRIGDFILGTPFLRNTYSVFSYDVPDVNGLFTDVNSRSSIQPRLGIVPLTDPTVAMQEFQTVRVLNQPLSPPGSSGSGGGSATTDSSNKGSKHISVGIGVLIGLLSLLGLCFIMFACVRWGLGRARRRAAADLGENNGQFDVKAGAYELANRNSTDGAHPALTSLTSEDTLRSQKFDEYLRKKKLLESEHTMSTTRTHVDQDSVDKQEAGDEWDDRVHGDELAVAPVLGRARLSSSRDGELTASLMHSRSDSSISPPANITEFGSRLVGGLPDDNTLKNSPPEHNLDLPSSTDAASTARPSISGVARPRPTRAPPTGPRTIR